MLSHLILILFLIGCSSNHPQYKTEIILGKITSENTGGYVKKIDSFQYLCRNAAEDMLSDLQRYNLPCNTTFLLDIELGYSNHGHIRQSNSLKKKSNFYTLNYKLQDFKDKEKEFSGTITAIDSFVIPSSSYAYIISSEASQIAGVSNLVKQLESEIVYLLHNNCK